MARGGRIKRPLPLLDPIYGNRLITRFVNQVMKEGKKMVAQSLVYKSFDRIKQQGKDPVKIFELALANVGPRMEVRPRRIGGASYQVPVEVRGERRISLAIHWIIAAARKRSNKEFHTFDEKLTAEFVDASTNQGEAIKKRDMTHRMAEANKAFAHFRW